jgi:aspartate carbamoyltransferase catalytic subunit
LAKTISPSIINAGDGQHEHPTQALLDMLTVRLHKQRLEGLKVSIIGDIAHSRVARSNVLGFTKMGSEVTLAGPPTFIPSYAESLGAKVTYDIDDAIVDADVIMMLRIQLERQNARLFPSIREYSRLYGLNKKRLEKAKKDAVIMHPGPINRGVEIDPDVADGPHSVILEQVSNGVAVRMAVLYLLLGGVKSDAAD